MTRALWLSVTLACTACGFGHDVEQDGSYVIVPGTHVTDSAPYPLASLLVVEEDIGLGQTRVYCFTGDLRSADLGLEDLRRIAARHGGFQMAFDPPRERIDARDIRSRSRPLQARIGDRSLELARLDDEGLRDSGAHRYLSNANSSDSRVAAYFTALDGLAPITIERRGIAFEPEIEDPVLGPVEDDGLRLSYESSADYVVMELGQTLQPRDNEVAAVEALVRTSLAPNAPYAVGRPLLTDVAGQGCWSRDHALRARLTQVARRYEPRAAGDWAVIHLRIDAIEIGTDGWTRSLGEPIPAVYCSGFE